MFLVDQVTFLARPPAHIELRLKGTTGIGDVAHSYGLDLPANPDNSLEQTICDHLEQDPTVDASIILGGTRLRVCEMVGSRIATVGLLPPDSGEEEAEE